MCGSLIKMSYDHVAMLPFLIDPSLLTPDEAAERAKDPIAWASKRYNQPESIFRKAGKCILVRPKNGLRLE